MTNGTVKQENQDDRQILRARALALARPPERLAASETVFDLLEFRLAQERYALESRWSLGGFYIQGPDSAALLSAVCGGDCQCAGTHPAGARP